MKLQFFKVDPERHRLVVDVQFYQMDLQSVVESARRKEPDLFNIDGDELPSWSKFAADPIKAKGFWVMMLQSLFEGKHNHSEIDFDYQRKGVDSGIYMMFLPGNMKSNKKDNKLEQACEIAQQCLTNFEVTYLANSSGVKNATAQKKVKELVEKARKSGKRVLILSTCLAQRSFSVGEISAVFLAYDRGESGATIQKISRGLTPNGDSGKIGRVVSLSFDPNRDDKLDSLILQTAINYKKSHGLKTTNEALALVLKSVDIFNCTENGAVKIRPDQYLNEIVNYNRISRVVGRVAHIENLSEDLKQRILDSNFSGFKPSSDVAEKGKVSNQKKPRKNKRMSKESQKEEKKLREKIVAICDNLDVIVLCTEEHNLMDALTYLEKDDILRQDVEEEFGMPIAALRSLVNEEVINLDLIELYKYEK